MGEDREQQSQFEHSSDQDREENENLDEDGPPFEQPSCPRCGWHNTRLSHTSNVLDMMVGLLGMRAYRCRSCGNRFRALRRRKA